MDKDIKVYQSLNIIEVDSLKIRIPFKEIEILNSEIVDKIGVYNCETGEEIEEPKPRNWYKVKKETEQNRTLYGYKYEIQNIKLKKGMVFKFLCIQLNSKILQKDYLQGITKENISKVYDSLIRDKIVYFSLDAFLNSECTDIDFKKDILNDTFSKSTEILRDMSRASKQSKKGVNRFDTKENKGIEWSNRRTASPSNPFLKIYSKVVQCLFDKAMIPFYEEYLKPEDIENRIRIEYTLKNLKHLKKYGIEGNRLKDILELNQAKKNDVLRDMIKIHLETRTIERVKPKEGLKPTEMIFYNTLSYFVDTARFGKEEIVIIHTKGIEPKQRKSEAKKKLNNIYDTYIKTREKAKENESISNLFNALNWQ